MDVHLFTIAFSYHTFNYKIFAHVDYHVVSFWTVCDCCFDEWDCSGGGRVGEDEVCLYSSIVIF